MKQITIIIKLNKLNETDNKEIIDNLRIKLKEWSKDNFWDGSKAEIYINENENNRLE